MKEPSNLIQSVDRAITVLEIVAGAGEIGIALKDLSNQLQLGSSTTHHLVATLNNRGILEQDPASKRYRLGIRMVELGNAALKNTSLAKVAQPYLEKIFAIKQQTVSMIAFHGLLRIPILEVHSRKILSVNGAPLEISTLHATGSGKLLLAYLPEPEINSYLKSQRLERFTGNTFSDPLCLQDELVRIREQGYALDHEEYGMGVSCISVPVQDASKRVVACIDIAFPLLETDDQSLQSMTEVMVKSASDLSAQLKNVGLTVS